MTSDFRYTTEHIDETHILVRVYKKGCGRIYDKFIVEDYGDYNAVRDDIETRMSCYC